MPQLALIISLLLLVLGLGGYGLGFVIGNEYASWTALIPAGVGLLILICAVIALRSEAARKHAMHAAVVVALLGAILSLVPLFRRVLNPEVSTTWLAKLSVLGMLGLCLWLVIAGVMSFIRARRDRVAGQAP